MAKMGKKQQELRRQQLVTQYATKREALKKVIYDRDAAPEERFQATLKLAEMPRNSSKVRLRNRCGLTGRPRGYYRKFKMCRIELRRLASLGKIPGMVKSSW